MAVLQERVVPRPPELSVPSELLPLLLLVGVASRFPTVSRRAWHYMCARCGETRGVERQGVKHAQKGVCMHLHTEGVHQASKTEDTTTLCSDHSLPWRETFAAFL
jgi:hypothetical protein